MLKEHISETPRIAFAHDLGKAIYNTFGLFLSIAILRYRDCDAVRGGKRMVVLEVVHVVVGNGRLRRWLDLDLADADFGFETPNVDIVVDGSLVGVDVRRHGCKAYECEVWEVSYPLSPQLTSCSYIHGQLVFSTPWYVRSATRCPGFQSVVKQRSTFPQGKETGYLPTHGLIGGYVPGSELHTCHNIGHLYFPSPNVIFVRSRAGLGAMKIRSVAELSPIPRNQGMLLLSPR